MKNEIKLKTEEIADATQGSENVIARIDLPKRNLRREA